MILSALFNFSGVYAASHIAPQVTDTIINMVSFENLHGEIAMASALFSIIVWAVLAWYFGIPTSESHALLAGLLGSNIAVSNGFSGVNAQEWIKAIYGLFTSCFGGFIIGLLLCKTVLILFKNVKRARSEKFFKYSEILASFFMSFMHGAQDGQKFIAVLLLTLPQSTTLHENPEALVFLSSAVMALGTAAGGKKIIKAIGMDMVRLQKYQGFSADLAASLSLLISTVFGFPVSTTHAKTTAMMGAGFAQNKRNVNTDVIKDIALTWLLTFPGCGILSFAVTKLFVAIF